MANLHMHSLVHHTHGHATHIANQVHACTHMYCTHTHTRENENKTKLNCGGANILMYEVSVSVLMGASIYTRATYMSHESSVSLM